MQTALSAARAQYLRAVNLCDGAWLARAEKPPEHFRKMYDAKLAAHEAYLHVLKGGAA